MYNEAEDNEIISFKEFEKLFIEHDDDYQVLGQTFEKKHVVVAKDFYYICESWGVFELSLEDIKGFVGLEGISKNLGSRLALSLILKLDGLPVLLLNEEDKRIIEICKLRINQEKYGLDIDSKIIIG